MFTIHQIAACTNGRIISDCEGEVFGISTDSRTIRMGELFVPLAGEHFDGHHFITGMPDKGVTVALVSEEWRAEQAELPPLAVISVGDTLRALGDLAHDFRRRYEIPVVGITGSNGKTTCKEMLASILNQLGNGLKTAGNLNNLIGLPQMLFRMNGEHQWAILEMGMSEPGEIDRLAEIAEPQVGVVLNAFPAHLESMGCVENVARAKGELLLRLPPGGYAVINADDPLIAACPSPVGVHRVTFGINHTADIRADNIQSLGKTGQRFDLFINGNSVEVTLAAFGSHSIYNALAAAAAASALGVPPEIIANGLEHFRPYDKRFNLQQMGSLFVIDDTYNANPASTGAALSTLTGLKGSSHAYVALGDMLELGENEAELHRMIGVQAAQVADRLYLFGELSRYVAEGAISAGMSQDNVIIGFSHAEIAADICNRSQQSDVVLLKGSRGMKMELIAEAMKLKLQNNED